MRNLAEEELQHVASIEVMGFMNFAEKLAKYLEGTRGRQAQLARDAGVSPGQITKYLTSGVEPSTPVILRISRATGISLEYWLDEDMTEPPRSELTADEAKLLWAVRALNMGAEEVLRRIERGKQPEMSEARSAEERTRRDTPKPAVGHSVGRDSQKRGSG